MTNSEHTCPCPNSIPMTDIVHGSQISFLLILDKAAESSQNYSPDGHENELTPELILICPGWSLYLTCSESQSRGLPVPEATKSKP